MILSLRGFHFNASMQGHVQKLNSSHKVKFPLFPYVMVIVLHGFISEYSLLHICDEKVTSHKT